MKLGADEEVKLLPQGHLQAYAAVMAMGWHWQTCAWCDGHTRGVHQRRRRPMIGQNREAVEVGEVGPGWFWQRIFPLDIRGGRERF